MATKIRLKRLGGKHDPHFRIVIADSRKKRDGRAVEELGYYCPIGEETTLEVNAERVQYWLDLGAQPTETVHSLLVRAGVLEGAAGDETEAGAEAAAEADESEDEAEEAGDVAEETPEA